MKFKTYKGKPLPGKTHISFKIDGICAERLPGSKRILSKAGKPLHNIPTGKDWIRAEVFLGNWEDSSSACRTFTKAMVIREENVYPLLPKVDKRLVVGIFEDITKAQVEQLYQRARRAGHEGLVLFNFEQKQFYRRKPVETYDVEVLGMEEGKGKYEGMMGKLLTKRGKVGGGYTDKQRAEFWLRGKAMNGVMIEVRCSGLQPSGRFREPRFVRERFDK